MFALSAFLWLQGLRTLAPARRPTDAGPAEQRYPSWGLGGFPKEREVPAQTGRQEQQTRVQKRDTLQGRAGTLPLERYNVGRHCPAIVPTGTGWGEG